MAGPRPALAIGDGYASSERGNNNQDLDGSPWSGGSKAGSVSEPEVTPVKKRFFGESLFAMHEGSTAEHHVLSFAEPLGARVSNSISEIGNSEVE